MPTVHEPAVLRRYIRNQAWLVAGFNGLINFGYTSYLWQDLPEVRFAGPGGAGVDLTMTAVVIGFLSTLLGTPGARSKLRRLAVSPVPLRPRWLRRLPDQLVLRSLVVAVVAGVLLGTPVGMSVLALAGASLSPVAMSTVKLVLSVAISLVVVPWVVRAAAADVRRHGAAGPRDASHGWEGSSVS